jgi:pheromone shutdown protein TraB
MANLVLIGTGHVFRIEETIADAIEAICPDHVLVELDPPRLQALYARAAGAVQTAAGGIVHRKLQEFQEQVAEDYGATPGGEMLAAVNAGRMIGADIGLIDRDVNVTMKRAMGELTLREKMRAGGSIIKNLVAGLFGRAGNVESELAAYSENPEAALADLAKSYPTVRRVVIDERDQFMCERINEIVKEDETAVVVVGDGHVPGMSKMLAEHTLTIYRLPQVRQGELPKPPGSKVRFGFQFHSP